MPAKGDDFDSIIADVSIEHLGNAVMNITPKGATHQSVATACIRGIFRQDRYEAGNQLSFLPVFVFKTDTIKDPLTGAVLTPKRDDLATIEPDGSKKVSQEYKVAEAEVEAADMTRIVFQSKLA